MTAARSPAAQPPAAQRLPDGFRVRLSHGVRALDGGRTLVGGSPPRLLYLKPRAHLLLRTGELEVHDTESAALARLLLDRGVADPVVEGAPTAPTDVTVVIPVKDRTLGVARLLAALPAGMPAVVVDDGSTDAGALAAVARAAGARLLRHDAPRGPSAARNSGLRAVRTPNVAFLDSDVVPRPGALELLVAHLADPCVGIVAPRISALANDDRSIVGRYEAARSSLDLGAHPALVAPRSRVAYVPSACLIGRVAAFGEGFNEAMEVAEDVDLVWRTISSGWRVRYEPSAVVEHDHRTAPREWLARKAFYGTGAAPLALRHGGAVAPVVVSPWTAAVALTVLNQRRWSSTLGAVITAAATVRLSRKLSQSPQPLQTAATLAPLGLGTALWQTGSAMTRHWWPAALGAAAVSRRARRALAVAAVAEGLADWARVRPELDPVRYTLLRRADDVAYGSGVWWGAIRHRTVAPLRPAVTS